MFEFISSLFGGITEDGEFSGMEHLLAELSIFIILVIAVYFFLVPIKKRNKQLEKEISQILDGNTKTKETVTSIYDKVTKMQGETNEKLINITNMINSLDKTISHLVIPSSSEIESKLAETRRVLFELRDKVGSVSKDGKYSFSTSTEKLNRLISEIEKITSENSKDHDKVLDKLNHLQTELSSINKFMTFTYQGIK